MSDLYLYKKNCMKNKEEKIDKIKRCASVGWNVSMSNSENFHLVASTFFQCFSMSNGSIRAVNETAISCCCCCFCYVFITNAIILATSKKSTCDLFVIWLCIVDRESYFVSVLAWCVALFLSLVAEWPIQLFSMPFWFWIVGHINYTHSAMSENFELIAMQKQYNDALKRPTDIMHRCTYNTVEIHTHKQTDRL